MGPLNLPESGRVYVDTAPVIYTVERHPVYEEMLRTLWAAMAAGRVQVITSELTILEALVQPLRHGDDVLIGQYEELFRRMTPGLRPITPQVLRAAARLRAETRLRTPDAIHLSTALAESCALVITNDADFRRAPGLTVTVLKDVAS